MEAQLRLMDSGLKLEDAMLGDIDAFLALAEAVGLTVDEVGELIALFDSPSSAAAITSAAGKYTVKAGDTMSKIAASLGVSLAHLIASNPQIANPDLIFPGQVLSFAGGGVVPGPIGAPVPAIVHGGERITPPDGGGTTVVQLVVNDRIAEEIVIQGNRSINRRGRMT